MNFAVGAISSVYVGLDMSPDYIRILDDELGIRMAVEFKSEGREVTDYAVVLVRGSGSAAVPWEKECGPRSARSKPATAR